MTRRQCSKCPWRVDVDPCTIPRGYSAEKHRQLAGTIAQPSDLLSSTLRIMACHNTPVGREQPCVGWLHNQLGVGNNLTLRLAVFVLKKISPDYELVGEQRERFEDTLPPED